jgi:hypothetical protein
MALHAHPVAQGPAVRDVDAGDIVGTGRAAMHKTQRE